MGIYLNPSDEMFRKAVSSEIYVDKTMLIKYTNKWIGTKDGYLAVSRPRRFGKTTALDMLCAYYGRACGNRDLFAPFQIASDNSFAKHLGKYQIVQMNMRDVVSRDSRWDQMQEKLTKRLAYEIRSEFPKINLFDETDLVAMLEDVYAQVGIPFVFLIDEWDAIFRVHTVKDDTEEQTKYLEFLRALLKDKAYVALAYMTGILPIKKYGEHSALNMFTEYSMTNQRELAECTGFTEEEVHRLCVQYDMPYDEMKQWYDGYRLKDISVYNPRSVVMSVTGHDFDNYWTKTENYEALKRYIDMNMDGLKDKVIRMIAAEHIPVNTLKFVNDMTTFHSADDVLTLLIHLGYLTYDYAKKECFIPNQEVQQEFINSIEDGGWEEIMDAIRDSDQLLKATLQGNETLVEEMLERVHQNETSIMAYNDENALASVIAIAYYAARKDFRIFREFPAGKGYADMVYLPKKDAVFPAMVVELKVDQGAETAISQIKEKRYSDGLKGYTGKVLLVGIAYDRKTKRHDCRIEEIFKEK